MKKKIKILLTLLFKISVSFLFFYLLAHQIEMDEIRYYFRGIRYSFFAIAIFLLVIGMLLKAYRWKLFFSAPISFWKFLQIYFIGQFFNFFFPSNIGGDVSRIALIYQEVNDKYLSLNSVVIERIIGSLALMVIALFSVFFAGNIVNDTIRYAVFLVSFAWIMMSFFIFYFPIPQKIENYFRNKNHLLAQWFLKIFKVKKELDKTRQPILLFKVFIVSLLFHISWIFCLYFVGLSLGIKISFFYYWVFFPIIQALITIPISINGLGIQESAFVYFFKLSGIRPSTAFSLALGFRLITIIGSLIGLLFFLVRKIHKKKEEIQDENTFLTP